MKNKKAHIDKREFDSAKELLSLHFSYTKVARITKRSVATIRKISDCATFQDYKKLNKSFNERHKKLSSSFGNHSKENGGGTEIYIASYHIFLDESGNIEFSRGFTKGGFKNEAIKEEKLGTVKEALDSSVSSFIKDLNEFLNREVQHDRS